MGVRIIAYCAQVAAQHSNQHILQMDMFDSGSDMSGVPFASDCSLCSDELGSAGDSDFSDAGSDSSDAPEHDGQELRCSSATRAGLALLDTELDTVILLMAATER